MSVPVPQLPLDDLQTILEANQVPRHRFPVVEIAIRGYLLDTVGKRGRNDRGAFDDARFLIFPGADGADRVLRFFGNTDPGHWKKNRATLCTGIHIFAPGPHPMRGGYPAFRQAEVFTVTRDGQGSARDSGWFGVNNHKARGAFGSWWQTDSAGCQTQPVAHWPTYQRTAMAMLDQHGNEKGFADFQWWLIGEGKDPGPKLPLLPYVLIDETERRAGRLVVSRRYFPR